MQEDFLKSTMEKFGGAVYRLSLCRLQSIADAEDAYSEVFLRLYNNRGAESYDDEHLKAWLLRVAVNICNDIGRKKKRQRTLPLEEAATLSIEERADYSDIWEAVGALPEKYRTVFHLFYAEGYKSEEIANILKIPSATVRIRLSRAREMVKKELNEYGF